MKLAWTENQRRAITEHERNLVVLAAAGSGKTHVLVERYLALLDAHPDWSLDSLVAITFTRKATRVMRERVREALRQRALDAGEAERPLWLARLASVDSAGIGTIDSLCARILRVSAAEAGIDPDFAVLDENEADVELERTLEEALARLATDNDVALRLFAEYDRTQIVAALREQVASHENPPLPDDLLQLWQGAWDDEVRRQLAALRESPAYSDAVNWQETHSWPDGDKLSDLWETRCPMLLELGEAPEPARAVELLRGLRGNIGNVGTVKNWKTKDLRDVARTVLMALRDEVKQAHKAIGDGITELDQRAAALLPHWQRLIEQVQLAYRARKKAANQLDFADLARLTRTMLQQPEVRDRLRGEFRHVLVDEFHDTSPIQWEIIRALADPSTPGRLFIVGDPRQSIYAFRGADVRVFRQARQQLLASGGAEIPLSRSFRTHQPLLDVLNEIFHQVLRPSGNRPLAEYEVDFGDAMDAQRQNAPGPQPALELMSLDLKAAELNANDGHRRMAHALAVRLRERVQQGRPVHDRKTGATRPLAYRDMALLFQTHRSMPFYEEAFKELALPYVTVGGRGFYGRQEVLDLLNLLRALHNPADDLALASALRSPLFALSDDALLALRLMGDEDCARLPLWDALQQAQGLSPEELPRAHAAAECLRALAQLAGRLTVDDLLREALRRSGYLAALTGLPDGHRRRGNVEKLLEKAAASGALLYTDFVAQLGELSAREVREGEAALEADGAITLMTVHQAKGLEFPLVVLLDADRNRTRSDDAVLLRDDAHGLACRIFDVTKGGHRPTFAWQRTTMRKQQRELAERRRLFYVAATRARDTLLVCGQMRGKPASDSWLAWLADALKLEDLTAAGRRAVGRGQVVWDSVDETAEVDDLPRPDRRSSMADGQAVLARKLDAPPALLQTLAPQPSRTLPQLTVTRISRHFEQLTAGAGASGGQDRSSRALGAAVHEALRWWRPDLRLDEDALRQHLRRYCRSQGLRRTEKLLRQATVLMVNFERSALCAQMKDARRLLRELPFIYQRGDYLIDGRLDLLMQDEAGHWTLVDFKTTLPGEDVTLAQAQVHALRHHLQLGLYAAAVCRRPGIEASALTVQIHYLQQSLDVVVATAGWQRALSRLEECASRALQSDVSVD